MNTNLYEAARVLVDQLATDSFCELCHYHAPTNDAGTIIGPLQHAVACPLVDMRAALAKEAA